MVVRNLHTQTPEYPYILLWILRQFLYLCIWSLCWCFLLLLASPASLLLDDLVGMRRPVETPSVKALTEHHNGIKEEQVLKHSSQYFRILSLHCIQLCYELG
jgi:hypothetical protein